MIGDPYYNQDLRKATIAFGALFNTITLVQSDKDGNEIKRVKVPLGYGSKEKYLALLQADPDLKRPVSIQLPRMAFELVGFLYDPARSQQQMIQDSGIISTNPNRMTTKYVAAPWNLTFNLHIITREIDDGLQIIQQILHYFRPDYSVSINFEPDLGLRGSKDTPIKLEGVDFQDTTQGPADDVRILIWTLTFTMRSYIYGPTRQQGQILHVYVNYYDDTTNSRLLTLNGAPVTANSVKGSNIINFSANVESLLTTNDVIQIQDSTLLVKSINGNNVTSNVYSFSTNKFLDVEKVLINQRIAAYTANVTPNTALSTDNYTITEIFQDFI